MPAHSLTIVCNREIDESYKMAYSVKYSGK